MEQEKLAPKYYSVKQIKELENCGRDRAYEIARQLPHERRGKSLFVFAEDYINYYKQKREQILNNNQQQSNVYEIQKFR